MKTAYVEHPLSKEEKQKYNREGYKVVDITFAPEKLADGDKIVKKEKPKPEGK